VKLPAQAIIVVCEEMKQALGLLPRAVVLAPEEYQKLLNRIEQLEGRLAPDRPLAPSVCRLSGRVEEGLARLQARFQFRTEQPQARVNLACQRGVATAASLDGHLPVLLPGDDGLIVQVEKPGDHEVLLELLVPVSTQKGPRGTDQGIDLDLPRAAITSLEQFDLPAGASEAWLGTRLLKPRRLDGHQTRLDGLALGPAQRLDLTWKGATTSTTKVPPVLAAIGRISLRIQETEILSDIDLTLQVLRGATVLWRLRLPFPAAVLTDVKASPQDEERIRSMERKGEGSHTLLQVTLKEPSNEPVHLTVHVRQPRSTAGISIRGVEVRDALSQKGEIEIRAPDDMRLHYTTGNAVTPREVSDEQRRDNVQGLFSYWSVPATPNTTPPPLPLVTLQVETIQGLVEARTLYNLQLQPGKPGQAGQARLSVRVDVNPVRAAVDQLELLLPQGFEYDRQAGVAPAELVEDATLDSSGHKLLVRLAQRQRRSFAITLTGAFTLSRGQLRASWGLPRLAKWVAEKPGTGDRAPLRTAAAIADRGAQVTVSLPEGLELAPLSGRPDPIARAQEAFRPLRALFPISPGRAEYTWKEEHIPASVELSWQPQRPTLRVETLADVSLSNRRIRVHEQLHLHFGQTPPAQLALRLPNGLPPGSVRVLKGGLRDLTSGAGPSERLVSLTALAGREQELVLEYIFSPPSGKKDRGNLAGDRSVPLSIPLVEPAQALRGETRVRVWSDSGEALVLADKRWQELPTEAVADRDSLPVLVAHRAAEPDMAANLPDALVLEREADSGSSRTAAIIDRELVRVIVDPTGEQSYQVRWLLERLTAPELHIELPRRLPRTALHIRLDGKSLLFFRLANEAEPNVEVGQQVWLPVEPELYPQPVILEIKMDYHPDAAVPDYGRALPVLLQLPVLTDAIVLGRVQWQIELPAGLLPLPSGTGLNVEQRWGWAGWLPAPRPAASASQLEQWLTGKVGTAEMGSRRVEGEPALVCWQTNQMPLTLWCVPQRLWLLFCSLVLLILGLGLFYARAPRTLFWLCLISMAGVVAAVGIFWPAALPAVVYGCEPGILVLLIALTVQAAVHARYRRRVVFMPGFQRAKSGSSLIQSNNHRGRELSTIEQAAREQKATSSGVGSQPG
jgi:hypothetical protein